MTGRYAVRLVMHDGNDHGPEPMDDLLEAAYKARELRGKYRGEYVDLIDLNRVDPPDSGSIDWEDVIAADGDRPPGCLCPVQPPRGWRDDVAVIHQGQCPAR